MAALKTITIHGVDVQVFPESILVCGVSFGRRSGSVLMGDNQIEKFVSALLIRGAEMNQKKIKDVLGIK